MVRSCCYLINSISIIIMLIFIIYYMFSSIIYVDIVAYQDHNRIHIFSKSYYNIYCVICISSPALFILLCHSFMIYYTKSEEQKLRIIDLLRTKRFLVKENVFLKKKYDLPVHLKEVCVRFLINKKESVCPICLEQIDIKSNVYLTICGHLFHNDCINKNLEYSNRCPTCRKIIFYNDDDFD